MRDIKGPVGNRGTGKIFQWTWNQFQEVIYIQLQKSVPQTRLFANKINLSLSDHVFYINGNCFDLVWNH